MKAVYSERITRDPAVCSGNPIIKGTRIRVKVILDNLAEGRGAQEIQESYPSLSVEDVQAVIAFAAASVADEYCHPVPEALTA
jgi:uncharacterized protein (DUF433 family)